ncbi:class I SAM-dependent methyltransferase [Pedobacter sandarakinus]|uniref:class I SAM-dependent methyltransferase n=1 Tax=Pedobacter sandarakinus TaxID=353156 RepID=UPI00224574D2|nr:methyltransferase domain-containing protein [Pedobacter sandarakinus]MCX2573975.1 methyltransferase domain-containing protein [Pedobacter sandarakinus]
MMIRLKYYFQRPEKGFDPVPLSHAATYADHEFRKFNTDFIDEMVNQEVSFSGKSLLDLGGGPGQYSLAFAKKGAQVTWHDISRNYLNIVKNKAKQEKVNIKYSLGYLEDAHGTYDIVFNRICWYYCINDYAFAKHIYQLVNDGGYAFIMINNDNFLQKELQKESRLKKSIIKFSFWLNEKLNVKLTHVHPSHAKLKKVFAKYHFSEFNIQRTGLNTLITFKK